MKLASYIDDKLFVVMAKSEPILTKISECIIRELDQPLEKKYKLLVLVALVNLMIQMFTCYELFSICLFFGSVAWIVINQVR